MNSQTKHLRRRTLTLILMIVALVVGGISITRGAAQAAIPGDALYPVKTTIEQTRLSLAQDAGDRAQMKMAFAEQRLEEIAALIEEGRYREVNKAVLAFEADINSAILELETVSQVDPGRGAQIALEITAALTRYAQSLSVMAANAPESVKTEVARALDTAQIAGSLELPTTGSTSDDNSNANDNGNAKGNGDDSNTNNNGNANSNGDDGGINDNGDDRNANGNGDDGNANSNADDSNENGNANGNADDSNANSNGDDGNANNNGNANGNGDDSNANSNGDDGGTNANDNTNGNANSNSNNNGDD